MAERWRSMMTVGLALLALGCASGTSDTAVTSGEATTVDTTDTTDTTDAADTGSSVAGSDGILSEYGLTSFESIDSERVYGTQGQEISSELFAVGDDCDAVEGAVTELRGPGSKDDSGVRWEWETSGAGYDVETSLRLQPDVAGLELSDYASEPPPWAVCFVQINSFGTPADP